MNTLNINEIKVGDRVAVSQRMNITFGAVKEINHRKASYVLVVVTDGGYAITFDSKDKWATFSVYSEADGRAILERREAEDKRRAEAEIQARVKELSESRLRAEELDRALEAGSRDEKLEDKVRAVFREAMSHRANHVKRAQDIANNWESHYEMEWGHIQDASAYLNVAAPIVSAYAKDGADAANKTAERVKNDIAGSLLRNAVRSNSSSPTHNAMAELTRAAQSRIHQTLSMGF